MPELHLETSIVSRLKAHRAGLGGTGHESESKATNKHLWEQSWEEPPEDYLISIIKRMPWVCSSLISAKGGCFDESSLEYILISKLIP